MASKKAKAFTLGSLLFISGLVGCGSKDKNQDVITSNKHVFDGRVDDYIPEEEYYYIEHAADSILTSWGITSEKYYSVKQQLSSMPYEIHDVDFQNSAAGALRREVDSAANVIIDSYLAKFGKILKSYNVKYDKKLLKDYLVSSDVIFYGTNEDDAVWENKNAEKIYNTLRDLMLTDANSLSPDSTKELSVVVHNVFLHEMCPALYRSRKAIEQKYAKYFAGGMKQIELYAHTGYHGPLIYETGESLIAPYWITERSVTIKSDILPKEFFDDADEYTVKYVPVGQWRINKKQKGKTSSVTVVAPNIKWDTTSGLECLGWHGETRLSRRPYFSVSFKDNLYYKETIRIEKPQEVFPTDSVRAAKSEQLRAKERRLQKRHAYYEALQDSAYNQARQMWNVAKQKIK